MLDIRRMDGWTVLDRLKHDPNTRHIPVHISVELGRQRSLQLGRSRSQKPVTSEALAKALLTSKGLSSAGKEPAGGGR